MTETIYETLQMYVGGVEYIYASCEGFEVNGVTADPTLYTPELAVVAEGDHVHDATWLSAEWVTSGGVDKARALVTASTAGMYAIYLRLAESPEVVIRKGSYLLVEP